MKRNFFILFIILLIVPIIVSIKNLKENIDEKKNQINFLEKNLSNKKAQLANIHSKLLEKNINLENILFEKGINFENDSNRNIEINDTNYILREFKSDDIVFAKHPAASSSAYIDYYNDKLFLVTATGQFVYSNIDVLKKENFSLIPIKTNIQDLIKYNEFYASSAFGVKDFLIYKDNIFVSYIKEHSQECFSTSLLKAKLNFEYIVFKDFYVPKRCINKNEKFYNDSKHDKFVPHQSGGRLVAYDDKLIFSTGEYRYRILAQDTKNDFGKLISINLLTNEKNIVSLGHRNPQGLFYNKNLNYLFSTEHGPNGGDEINIIDLNFDKNNGIPNYGWPLSSYGRHYFDNDDDNDVRYKLSPLKKSHIDYGFKEPLKYFVPSVGISQIVGVNKTFYNSDNDIFFVGTMGTAKKLKEGMISLYFFEYKNNEIINDLFIPIKSRVRDIFFNEKEQILVMYLETNNSLAILKKK